MGSESHRVFRGGSWRDDAPFARVAYRVRLVPGNRFFDLGFRLVRVVILLQRIEEANVVACYRKCEK